MPVTPGEYQVQPDDHGGFDVVNTITGDKHAEGTTKSNAEHQKRLLYAVGHGWKPTHQGHNK